MVWCELHNKWDKILCYVSLGWAINRTYEKVSLYEIIVDILSISFFPISLTMFFVVGICHKISFYLPKQILKIINKEFYCSKKDDDLND